MPETITRNFPLMETLFTLEDLVEFKSTRNDSLCLYHGVLGTGLREPFPFGQTQGLPLRIPRFRRINAPEGNETTDQTQRQRTQCHCGGTGGASAAPTISPKFGQTQGLPLRIPRRAPQPITKRFKGGDLLVAGGTVKTVPYNFRLRYPRCSQGTAPTARRLQRQPTWPNPPNEPFREQSNPSSRYIRSRMNPQQSFLGDSKGGPFGRGRHGPGFFRCLGRIAVDKRVVLRDNTLYIEGEGKVVFF